VDECKPLPSTSPAMHRAKVSAARCFLLTRRLPAPASRANPGGSPAPAAGSPFVTTVVERSPSSASALVDASNEGSAVPPFPPLLVALRQRLTLVHFSAQLELCLTQENTLHTLNTP